ncbi:immune inhibitor A peptidase M6 [Kribbella sp. VKM Ac-2527]|uniref:Zinc carboxypeptidase n=1 Tax=Kribbella caucasensis TaxID=2512215 RepID=A0A4R6K7P4_9ACTN|nr:M14 family metallopeptidase [Kribbella sp. VKM Ac-2527]TDO45023.1 immune inhibitor A peptidase M6 [Kribbella sp. VKM Ac-2527]
MRRSPVFIAVLALAAGALAAGTSATASPATPGQGGGGGLEVYVGELAPDQLQKLAALGLDHEDVSTGKTANGKVRVEAIISDLQAEKLRSDGVELTVKRVKGKKASEEANRIALAGNTVYRSYSEEGGIRDELIATANANPGLAKLVNLGKSVNGQDILAVKVTKGARTLKDGKRPAVLYAAAQHAREWITPEMVRRLMHHYLDGYGSNAELTALVDTTELWFLPVANPDGYDFTFTVDNRLWRKNLRDNNGDGAITVGDGVDPNRNFAVKWGYDNEGSSPDPNSETFRGTGPNSEPETKALDALFQRIGFEHFINYHSAAELLLYGIGWQQSTPSPDDIIYEAMVGDDANPAVPGYDPDISAELYITNGDTDTHATVSYGTLGFTPEMTTCQTVSASIPDDEWLPEDCVSGFNFPDDEELIQAEFAKNIPFALSVAKSTHDPDDPVSVVGLKAADLVADPFAVSHGTTQPVAVTAKRALLDKRLNYRINGGRTVSTTVSEWAGGERYGDTHDDYYAEYRGTVRGTRPGDSVEVWFTGVKPGQGPASSAHFTYKVATDIGGDVLILAAEDVTGASPAQGQTSAKYADEYAAALTAAGRTSDVYDVDVNGRTAPHHLGVLSHYRAVVWEHGDDIVTRELGQPGGTAAELALDLELTVRDYLNEGGKLLYTGKYAGFASGADGVYFYNPFEEEQGECTVRAYPCLPLLNDFQQYWLGAYNYVDDSGTDADGNPFAVSGVDGAFTGFAGTFNGADSANNQDHTAAFLLTSSFLPPAEFPQFASSAAFKWQRPGAAPFEPFTGDWYLYSQRADVSYKRLTRTIDLTGATSGALSFKASYDTELDWDYLMVEAHTVGQDDWTTLPDTGGHTQQDTGQSCPAGWVEALHPHLAHYQNAACEPTGSSGSWNAATGRSSGWQDWNVDLTAYAGKQVEVSISYVSDWATQGLGVFIDDAKVTANGVTATETSFETDLGGWTVSGAAEGSAANPNDWTRTQTAFEEGAGVTTQDTAYVGFGAEGLTTQAMRNDLIGRSMTHLLGPVG